MASDRIEELARAFERFPGIGPRQARRFVFHLLGASSGDRSRIADLVSHLADEVRQCTECHRFSTGGASVCTYCSDPSRDDSLLLVIEKDQDLAAVERAGIYRGRYFVLGGVLTLSGKGTIRERELMRAIERKLQKGLKELILALSATSEGENTTDHLKQLLLPYRERIKLTTLGRGLATGSELEYSDAETVSGALQNRKET
jgi:recombination protein RecR